MQGRAGLADACLAADQDDAPFAPASAFKRVPERAQLLLALE
jgi:hypothetical protein